jgi:hypothetical protein
LFHSRGCGIDKKNRHNPKASGYVVIAKTSAVGLQSLDPDCHAVIGGYVKRKGIRWIEKFRHGQTASDVGCVEDMGLAILQQQRLLVPGSPVGDVGYRIRVELDCELFEQFTQTYGGIAQ